MKERNWTEEQKGELFPELDWENKKIVDSDENPVPSIKILEELKGRKVELEVIETWTIVATWFSWEEIKIPWPIKVAFNDPVWPGKWVNWQIIVVEFIEITEQFDPRFKETKKLEEGFKKDEENSPWITKFGFWLLIAKIWFGLKVIFWIVVSKIAIWELDDIPATPQ